MTRELPAYYYEYLWCVFNPDVPHCVKTIFSGSVYNKIFRDDNWSCLSKGYCADEGPKFRCMHHST